MSSHRSPSSENLPELDQRIESIEMIHPLEKTLQTILTTSLREQTADRESRKQTPMLRNQQSQISNEVTRSSRALEGTLHLPPQRRNLPY
jgi:hypothetical protein